MKSVFINQADHSELIRNGYLRKPMLNATQIADVLEIYKDHFPQGTVNFYSSTFLENIVQKKELSKKLVSVLLPSIQKHFENYKLLGAQLLVKNPGNSGKMPFHQDWTVVDENKFRSMTVWIALSDLTELNGSIKVVPASHEFSRVLRGPGNFDMLTKVQSELENFSQTLILKAGEAFIFDHSLIHGSGVNHSNVPRIAVAVGLVHREADLVFYHRSDDTHFEKYKVKDDFFITFPNDDKAPAEAELLGTIEQKFDKIGAEDFKNRMKVISKENSNNLKIKELFADKETQLRFEEDGYVKINLLNQSEVNDLRNYYESLHHDHIGDYGFHISLENKSSNYVDGVFKKLFHTILPKLDPLLVNYKAFTASYVIKEAGLQNIVPPHQDWSFVDEDEFCSATVWIPLMDVNKNNGALSVIKGSHKKFNLPRPSPSPQAKSILSDHAFTLFPFVEVIEMKAGEALVFNNKTIHASPPNISGKTRIAAGIGITQKNAKLVHYYQLPGKEELVEKYEVDASFFPKYNNSVLSGLYNKGEKPGGLKHLSTFKKNAPNFTKTEITELVCSTPGVKENRALMEELATHYNYNIDGTKKEITNQKQYAMTNQNPNQGKTNANEPTPGKKEFSSTTTAETKDTRTFFQKYTPANIIAEIKYRLKKS